MCAELLGWPLGFITKYIQVSTLEFAASEMRKRALGKEHRKAAVARQMVALGWVLVIRGNGIGRSLGCLCASSFNHAHFQEARESQAASEYTPGLELGGNRPCSSTWSGGI